MTFVRISLSPFTVEMYICTRIKPAPPCLEPVPFRPRFRPEVASGSIEPLLPINQDDPFHPIASRPRSHGCNSPVGCACSRFPLCSKEVHLQSRGASVPEGTCQLAGSRTRARAFARSKRRYSSRRCSSDPTTVHTGSRRFHHAPRRKGEPMVRSGGNVDALVPARRALRDAQLTHAFATMLSLRAQLFPSRSQRLAKKEQKKAEKMARKKATGVSRVVEEEPPKATAETPPPPPTPSPAETSAPTAKPKKIRRRRRKSRFLKRLLKSVLVLGTLTGVAVAVGLEVNKKPAKKVATVVEEAPTSPPPLVTEPEKKKFFWER